MRGYGSSKRNSCSHVRGLLGEKRGQLVHMWWASLKKWYAVSRNAMGLGGEGKRRQWRPLKLTWTNKINVYNIHQCSQLLSVTFYYFMGYSTGQTTPNWTKGWGWRHLLQSLNNCQLYGLVKNFGFELFSPRSIVHVYSQDSQEGCEITISYIMYLNLVILHCFSTIHLYSSW